MAVEYSGRRAGKVADPFYMSPEWKRARLDVLRRDGYRCVMCGVDVRGKGKSRVDHVRPRATCPALSLERANLRTLCVRCDNQRHSEKARGSDDHGAKADGTPRDPNHWWNK